MNDPIADALEAVVTSEDDAGWDAWSRQFHRVQRIAISAAAAGVASRRAESSPKPPEGAWMTTTEAAAVARVGLSTLQRSVAQGELKASNVGSPFRPRWRIHKDELDKWITSAGTK
jgi:excisionase family DNA binding protein